ncbi:1-aminocyclopropane-1-carboxylate synthase 4-like [Gopherus evgoodei]|uniref:1-aminocyclopropane-1-carboxylate synthase 4-like n=1 Tax=Gopherus evgoodei TaxID=1825980 RepID=UPI0011CF37ED|nr:1-aminocyclopropane-1-carboxylate synthase 4-like [Gopherus evgoodei]
MPASCLDRFRKYLRTGTFEEEMLLWRRFLDNKVLLSCGKAFECSEPGWFRIIFADKTHRLQLGMQRIRRVLEEREREILSEDKDQPCQSDQDGKADSTDEVIFCPITRSLFLLVALTSVTSLASCSSRCAHLTGCRRTQQSSLHRRSQRSMTCSANWLGNSRDLCSSMGLIEQGLTPEP